MNSTLTKVFLLILGLTFCKPVIAQDYLVEATFLGSRSKFELLVLFGQAVDYDIDLYRIRYKTPGTDQLPDTASGLMVLPQVPAGTLLPIVVYEHGTTNGPTDVPSQLRGGFEVAMAYGAFGFVTVAPDYLGLGDSRGFHPYVHALTEAYATLDMLNSCLEYLDLNEPEWDPNFLFVAGYSQGGHASMATHKEIEDFWSFVYPVTAATHMSGPYSISGVMRDKILSDESYGTPSYIAYVMLGYQEVYGNIYNNITDIFKEPFATSIQNFYDRNITLSVLNNQLISALAADGDTINKRMFQDSVLEGVITNPNHPINIALQDNDTYDWAPSAPTRLYYCGGDEQVPFENSLVAETAMQANGAADVQAINLNPTFSHGQCVFPAVLSSIDFFQSFVHPSALEDLNVDAEELQVFPNPSSNTITIDWAKAKGGMDYEIINAAGQTLSKGHSYLNILPVDQLTNGMYTIICTAGGETRMARFVRL
jgi:acetyl esterase/lipase